MKEITVSELKSQLEATSVIDVRELHEYVDGHVPGAIHIPLTTIPLRTSELNRETEYHIICEAGGRSAQACMYLAQQGYNVVNVAGGTGAWRSAGMETTKGESA